MQKLVKFLYIAYQGLLQTQTQLDIDVYLCTTMFTKAQNFGTIKSVVSGSGKILLIIPEAEDWFWKNIGEKDATPYS